MNKTLEPARKKISGELTFPGDKSIAHRALILGTLSNGTLSIDNVPTGRDVLSTRECLETMGAEIHGTGTHLRIEGLGLRGLAVPRKTLDCGNSGTTMRLLMGVCAGQANEALLTGDASLSQRPMKRVAQPLSQMNASFSMEDGGRPPVRVRGKHPLTPIDYTLPVPSAQVKSAVLLAGLFAEGVTRVEDPFNTRDHTERMLDFLSDGKISARTGNIVSVEPCLMRSDRSLTIPGDISSAAYFAAAAVLLPGSDILLRSVLLNPARMGFFNALEEMGAHFQAVKRTQIGGEPVGEIQVHASSLRGICIKAERTPSLIDEVPLLAVVAAHASGETRIEGLAELRVKESDRLAGTLEGLQAMGADARIDGEALIISGGGHVQGGRVQTRGDHRMAMAFSIASLTAKKPTLIEDAGCASISFPAFYETLERISQ